MQKFACLALPVFFAAGLGAQRPVIGIWKFDETAGLAAADSGPLGNGGNLVNFFNDPAQWVPGRFGNALQFDGTANYVDLPVGDKSSLIVGCTYHHISNALGRMNDRNPSQNEARFFVGFAWTL